MVDVLGYEVPIDINLTGFLSSSWIYVLIVAFIGFLLILGVIILLFFKTYNRKIIIFSQQNWLIPVKKTRGRVIRLNIGGVEVVKTLGGYYVSAYGKTMGRNTYWYERGEDGYLRNFILDKFGTVQYIEGDVRLFHTGLQNYNRQTYDKKSFMEKYGIHMLLFVFLIVLILGMWFIIGKVGTATEALAATAETNKAVVEALGGVLQGASNIQSQTGGSGIVPAG